MINVLVTGGAGYIGSHTCKALAATGFRPIVYDNLVHGHRWAVKWGPLEVGELQDRHRLSDIFAHYQPRAVIHFAAYAYVGESVSDPLKYYFNNVAGTIALLQVMKEHDVSEMVFSSSCAVYGQPPFSPVTEDLPLQPLSPYGLSKLMVEQILTDVDKAYGLRSITLRYFNVAGADPEGELGEDHVPETHLLPQILEVAAGERNSITIFGGDYPTPDGTCVRDYVHVSDLAGAHARALRHLQAGGLTRAFNLGAGHGYSVRQMIERVEQITGKKVNVTFGPRRFGDPATLTADATRARQELQWIPHRSNLDDIISSAWQWQLRKAAVKDASISESNSFVRQVGPDYGESTSVESRS